LLIFRILAILKPAGCQLSSGKIPIAQIRAYSHYEIPLSLVMED